METVLFVFAKAGAFFIKPLNLILLGLVAQAILLTRDKQHAARLLCLGNLVLLGIIGCVPASEHFLRRLENKAMQLPKPVNFSQLQGIIVLGGAQTSGKNILQDRGDIPLGSAAERMTKAVELAKQYPHLKIVFTGFSDSLSRKQLSESEADLAYAFFISQGIEKSRLILETQARNTIENVLYTQKAMLKNDASKDQWALITSAAHMPRAYETFKQHGFEDLTAISVDFRTDRSTSWQFDLYTGTELWSIIIREHVGAIWYRLIR